MNKLTKTVILVIGLVTALLVPVSAAGGGEKDVIKTFALFHSHDNLCRGDEQKEIVKKQRQELEKANLIAIEKTDRVSNRVVRYDNIRQRLHNKYASLDRDQEKQGFCRWIKKELSKELRKIN